MSFRTCASCKPSVEHKLAIQAHRSAPDAQILREATVKCLRIYATPDGESHFGDVEIPTTETPLFPNTPPLELSGHYLASRIRFVHVPTGVQEAGWHTAPGRVLAVWLDGVVE